MTKAAAPATCGVAMLVPWNQRNADSVVDPSASVCCNTPPSSPCDLSPPGAAIAICGPNELYGASRPCGPTALTANAPGYAAGYETPREPEFPAAQTTTAPRRRAYATAVSIASERPPPPRERLSTRAP